MKAKPSHPKAARRAAPARRWSAAVTRTSDAMTVKAGTFKGDDPKAIARAVKAAAESSRRRKASPYRSAVSLISFYENRGGRNLGAGRRRVLQRAKAELRRAFGKD